MTTHTLTQADTFPAIALFNSFGEEKPVAEIFQNGSSDWQENHSNDQELKASVVVFYPLSFSPVCGSELDVLQEDKQKFAEAGIQIIAVSCDSLYTLRAFKESKKYDFEFLSDFWPHGKLSQEVGAFDETKGVSTRNTFLVDTQGKVLEIISSELSEPRKVEQYFASFKLIV